MANDTMDGEKALVAHAANAALPAAEEWTTIIEMADALFRSGLLPSHIRSTQATLAIMIKGRELGVPAMQALSNIVVVNGKPTCNSELMLALIYRDHGDDALQFVQTTAERCTISYKRRGWTAPREYSFTIDDADMAGLLSLPSWRKYPAAMLRARCISAIARMAFPDSISGMYSYEEMGVPVEVREDDQVVLASSSSGRQGGRHATGPESRPARVEARPETIVGISSHDSSPEMDDVERKRAVAIGIQQLCRDRGLPVPGPYRDWSALARRCGLPALAAPSEMTLDWLERLLEHLTCGASANGRMHK